MTDHTMLPLNDLVLENFLKSTGQTVYTADPAILSEQLQGSFSNAGEERIAEMLTRLARPMVYAKSAARIDFEQTPVIEFLIDGLLPVGLTFLNGGAKIGKSRLMLQMAIALAEGGMFMGRRCARCGVLYLPLEDERADLENRLNLFLNGRKAPETLFYCTKEDFHFETPTLERGQLISMLEANLTAQPNIKVILIDVFGVIRSKRIKGEDFTEHERRDILQLLQFAAKHGIALVIAHHVSISKKRFGGTSEPVGSGAGSYVISATVHSEWLLTKAESAYSLRCEGRRIPRQDFAVQNEYPRWKYLGTTEDYAAENDPLILTIKQLVSTNDGSWRGTSKEIVNANDESAKLPRLTRSVNRNNFKGSMLRRLENAGITYKQIQNGNGVIHEFHSL